MERKELKTEIDVNWLAYFLVAKSGKQWLSWKKKLSAFRIRFRKSLLWPLLLCSDAISSREFNSQLQRLYQQFMCLIFLNMSSMTCLTSLVGGEIRFFCVSSALK